MDLVLPVAALPVFWDIVKCPVPDACDARRVRPWIRRFLRKMGYFGPIAITAVGNLSKVSKKILEAVSTSGITLYDAPYGWFLVIFKNSLLSNGIIRESLKSLVSETGHQDIVNLVGLYYIDNPPPTKIMVISPPHFFLPHLTIINLDEERHVVHPFTPDSTKAEAKRIWQTLFLEDPVRCSTRDTSASWVCGVCDNLAGQGFKDFMRHHSSREHAQEIPLWFTPRLGSEDNEAVEVNVDSLFEKNATTKVGKDNEAVEVNVDSPFEKNATTKASEDNAKHKKKRGREEEEEE